MDFSKTINDNEALGAGILELEDLFPDLLFTEPIVINHNNHDTLDRTCSQSSNTSSADLPQEVLKQWLSQSSSNTAIPAPSHQQGQGVAHQGRIYAPCFVSPAVPTPITLNILSRIHALFNHLPTHILPTPYHTPLPSFVVVIPQEAAVSMVRVMISKPFLIHHNQFDSKTGKRTEPLLPAQPWFITARTVLENRVLLHQMGLTGKGLNQQRQKDDIVRELMESLQEGQSANENVEGLEEKLRQHRSRHQRRYAAQEQFQVQLEPRWGIKQTRDLVDASAEESQLLATLSREKTKRLQARDKIEDLGSKLAGIDLARDVSSEADDLLQILRMPPSTLCRSFLDKSSLPSSLECKSIRDLQCEERFGGTSPSLVFSESDEPVSSSGNVPLSLDIKWGDNSATWERFQPTLLRNRYEHWVVQQELLDQNKTSGERSSSDILEELGFGGGATLSGHHDNKARGTKTLESVSRVDPREALNLLMTNLRSDAVMSSSELEVEGENSLDRYFSMDQLMEYQVPPSSRSAVSLFSLLAWSVGHPDAVVISDPSCNTDILRELDPDFIFEELDNVPIGAELLPGNPVATWARNYGILVDSWRQLSPTQQMQLMGHLAKMLAVIWEQFEVLDCTRSDVGVIQPSSTSLLDGARKRGTSLGVMDSLLALEQEFVQGSLTNDFSIALDPAPPYSSSSSTNSFAEESTLDEGQRMTTATDQSQENIHILPLDYQGRASPHPDDNHKDNFITMRQFDFSLDDLLINLGTRSISPPDRCPSQDIQIVEVTRWKVNSGEKQPASSNIDQESSLPSSVNKYQVQARSSSYPLVHLFSLPDIFCPVSLGGQDDSEESEGFAHKFVLLLAEHSTEAAEFLTDDVKVKEQKLYHRWMAEWHGRFLSTPNRLTKSRLISSNRLATAQETPSLEQPRRPQNDDFLSRSSDNQLESGARNAAEYRERLEFEATARFLEQMDEGKKVLMASATIAGSSSTISSTKTVSNQKEDMSWPGVQHLANQLGVGAQWLSSWAEPALGSNGVRFGTEASARTNTESSQSRNTRAAVPVESRVHLPRGQCGPKREGREQLRFLGGREEEKVSLDENERRLVRSVLWRDETFF